MLGKKILEELKILLDDPRFSRFNEINQAYRRICKVTKFSWLRVSSETLLSFQESTTTYSLDMKNIRVLTGVFIKGGTDSRWRLLEEAPPELFENLVRSNNNADGTERVSTPSKYVIRGGPVATIEITPSPDSSYNVRVDYIKSVQDITIESEVNLPSDYFDTVAKLAAFYVLRLNSDQIKQQLGINYYNEAMDEINLLVRDSHNNRTIDLDRKQQTWSV